MEIPASKDNTLYESLSGSISNGAGEFFFVGRTGAFNAGNKRRGVIAFNLTDSIPPGVIIQSVSLTLHMSRTRFTTSQTVALRKLLGNWGEGTSDALGVEGGGAASTTNSATWIHQFYNFDLWTTAGGDFSGTISATASVGAIEYYTWGSTANMVADVQGWLDNPASNFGWLLKGNESDSSTAKRFDSRENLIAADRPILTVTYLVPCCVNIRGDVNNDGADATILDLSYLVDNIFRGGPPADCPEEADLDGNGVTSTILDLTYLINGIFRGGPSPPACP